MHHSGNEGCGSGDDGSQTQAVKQVVDALDKQGFSQAYEQTRQFNHGAGLKPCTFGSCQVKFIFTLSADVYAKASRQN